MSPEVSGKVWEGTGRVPELPGARFRFRPNFGYEEGPGGRRLLRLETEVGPRCGSFLIFMADDLLERAARRPAATASCLQLHALPHRHPLMHRSGSARGRHGLGRAVTCHSAAGMLLSKHPQRPAAGSIPAQADARQGLLHGRALLPSQGLEEVRRASCHCILLTWLQLCLARLSPVFSHTVRCCSLFMHSLQVLAFCLTALRHAGAFQKSKIQEWPVDGFSESGLCAGLLREHVRHIFVR